MATQIKFYTPVFKNEYAVYGATPQDVIMLDIIESMKLKKFRSYKSYLKNYIESKRTQRSSISIKEIARLLKISNREADYLAVEWMNSNDPIIKGRLVQSCDLYTFYLSDVFDIVA